MYAEICRRSLFHEKIRLAWYTQQALKCSGCRVFRFALEYIIIDNSSTAYLWSEITNAQSNRCRDIMLKIEKKQRHIFAIPLHTNGSTDRNYCETKNFSLKVLDLGNFTMFQTLLGIHRYTYDSAHQCQLALQFTKFSGDLQLLSLRSQSEAFLT